MEAKQHSPAIPTAQSSPCSHPNHCLAVSAPICPNMVALLSRAAARSRSSSDSQTYFSGPPSYAFFFSWNSSNGKRGGQPPFANYLHVWADSATTVYVQLPYRVWLLHLVGILGVRNFWRRGRGSMFLYVVLWCVSLPGCPNDFPDEYCGEGKVCPLLGRFHHLPDFLDVHPGLCLHLLFAFLLQLVAFLLQLVVVHQLGQHLHHQSRRALCSRLEPLQPSVEVFDCWGRGFATPP